jgi:hypothetical protein
MKDNKFTVPANRPLSRAERTLIEWLLDNGISEAKKYRRQLTDIHVASTCSCGCPTIDLATGDKTERTTGPSQILADAEGSSPEGVPVNVILHARQNTLSELEVFSLDGTKNFTLPTADKLTITNEPEKPQQQNRGDRE